MEVKHLYVTFPTKTAQHSSGFCLVCLHFAKHTPYEHTSNGHKEYANKQICQISFFDAHRRGAGHPYLETEGQIDRRVISHISGFSHLT